MYFLFFINYLHARYLLNSMSCNTVTRNGRLQKTNIKPYCFLEHCNWYRIRYKRQIIRYQYLLPPHFCEIWSLKYIMYFQNLCSNSNLLFANLRSNLLVTLGELQNCRESWPENRVSIISDNNSVPTIAFLCSRGFEVKSPFIVAEQPFD